LKQADNRGKYLQLREEFPFFVYQSYSFKIKKKYLSAKFSFNISDKFLFKPKLKVIHRDFIDFEQVDKETLNNLVFHIGMVELISYWKATCSPKVIIQPHFLDEEQIKWWKKLYFNGLGEFFYLNGIQPGWDDFIKIEVGNESLSVGDNVLDENKVIVPIGGGKDSVVTLELLSGRGLHVIPFVVNPREAIVSSIETGGYGMEESLVVERTIDPKLFELNEQGFLNGHTPFSALLAFTSVLSGILANAKFIALSNESSANQSTVPGSNINHQYSKSFEFETDFNWYINKYVHSNVRYFSFLRPLNELQIAKLFSKFSWHFESFRSCNVGSKTDSWCGHCPKCLFTYTILSPFLSRPTLIRIFGKRLLDEASLSPILDELTGINEVKPFECVGTPEEVNVALRMTFEKLKGSDKIPALLRKRNPQPFENVSETEILSLMNAFNKNHLVPEMFLQYLTEAMHDWKDK
jgi:UDP-N-acetyl-alpha-D-muramoyl-L-alanyl-L-glutamate epimerase